MREVVAKEAFRMLHEQADAVLIDVRTPQEWALVGAPTDQEGWQPVRFIPWQMGDDQRFLARLEDVVPDRKTTVLFLCRSGGRSHHAASLAASAGYTDTVNVVDGFEDGHGPGTGWRAGGLPWDYRPLSGS